MPNDATFEIMAQLQNKNAADISFIAPPIYNIDDMDPRFCMVNLMFTGCFCLRSSKNIDGSRPGMIYIDGKATEAPLTPPQMPMFGQMIGIHLRRWLDKYDHTYHIKYTGAYDTDGIPLPDFEFDLKTSPRCEVGERYPQHDEIVLQAAREGAVLLKNDNKALPLGKNSCVNTFGGATSVFRSGCLGAGKINPRYSIRVKEGIEKYTSLYLNEELYNFYKNETNTLPSREVLNRAKKLSETAVIFISRCSSEAHDGLPKKGHYYLTDEERELIRCVSDEFRKTVVILNVAYPIETSWIDEFKIDAVLLTGLSGMAGGRALAEILEGSVNPSGKLPNTWAVDYYDYPSSKNFMTLPEIKEKYSGQDVKYLTTVYEEGIYVGYRYFDTFNKKTAFMFGHGLSYTEFEKAVVSFNVENNNASVDVCVKNIGKTSGKEVIALYASIPDGNLEQPINQLVAFAKTKELEPNESVVISLFIDCKQLKSYDSARAEWIIEPGVIDISLGGTPTEATVVGSINISKRTVISKAVGRITCPIEITELSKFDQKGSFPKGLLTSCYADTTLPYSVNRLTASNEKELVSNGRLITFEEVVEDPSLAEEFIAQMSDYELARLCVGGRTGWGAEDSGFAGMLFSGGGLEKYGIPEYYFADGNNGCNMFEPNIGFPVSTTMAASWNEELLFAEGVAIATEARDMGLNCILAPALNVQRNPLCGRHTEYFSEDPYLAGRMAGQESRGIESVGLSSCVKHFFGNNAETMRSQNHSIMSERTAREIYIRAFEIAMETHMPDSVMTGYNAANGSYCANDGELLYGILRQELGFTGYVMTDWNGYGTGDFPALINAGVSWIAPGGMDDSLVEPIVTALKNETLSRGRIQNNLVYMIKAIAKSYYKRPN